MIESGVTSQTHFGCTVECTGGVALGLDWVVDMIEVFLVLNSSFEGTQGFPKENLNAVFVRKP